MKQINTLNRLAREAHRAGIGHIYDVVVRYPSVELPGVTVTRVTPQTLETWPRMRHQLAARLGVRLGKAIR